MSGSIKWMIYTSDTNTRYAVRVDESNGELCNFDDLTPDDVGLPLLSLAGIKMRYVNLLSPALGLSRRLYCGKPDSDLYLAGGVVQLLVAMSGVAAVLHPFFVLSAVPERRPVAARPNPRDTGLLDGDDT